jgi:hypothetical protein
VIHRAITILLIARDGKAPVWTWIIVGSLYLLGMGLFALLGGLASAGEAFRQWGESHAAKRHLSPSS